MTRPLASWTTEVAGSSTAALERKVIELRAAGIRVCRLGIGEPDFPTPPHVKAAAIAAVREDFNGYTDTSGIRALREAIASRLREDIGVEYAADEIVATAGTKQALFNAIASLCGAGDEVLVPAPYWVSFPSQVRLAGATPVVVPSHVEDGYRLSADALAKAITPRTRAIIVNTPSNPSGAMLRAGDLEAIAALAAERDLWIISDEVYSAFTFRLPHLSIATLPGMRERTVVVSAVSKTYGMTGWRLGWLAAPRAVAAAATRFQSHSTSNAATIAQSAAIAALTGPQDAVALHRADYAARAASLQRGLATIRGLRPNEPDGGFFVWTDMSWWCGRTLEGRAIRTSDDLSAVLLDVARVAVAPGGGFGSDTHVRISFCAPPDEIDEGVAALRRVLGERS